MTVHPYFPEIDAMHNSTILIVDDTPGNIEILASVLKDYELLVATSGEEALELAAAANPDLILLDVVMPDIDGFELCRRLKADDNTRKIPIIFVTAMNQEVDEALGLDIGAIDYITKPISAPIVKARVRNHLELKRSRDILERQSMIDGLTGVANRRRFDEFLEQEWRRAMRNRLPISLILLDVDFFKRYNDKYGHLAGDDCLRKVARVIAQMLYHPADLVVRYGGEEFACILPETDTSGAVEVAQRLKDGVETLQIPHGRSTVAGYVTISLGVATAIPHPDTPPTLLIEAADRLLYEAKHAGRNRVYTRQLALSGMPAK